jgi:hypothetical protein
MSNHASNGTLIISFDLDGADDSGRGLNEAWLTTLDTLLSLLRDSRMAATWAARLPATCEAVREILGESVGHEIALRLTADSERTAATHRAARAIGQQLGCCSQAGRAVSTLMAESTPDVKLLQAVCRLGVAAVCIRHCNSDCAAQGWLSRFQKMLSLNEEQPPQPRLMRYGLWEMPTNVLLPSAALSIKGLKRRVQEAVACGDVLHASVDVRGLHRGRAGGLKRLEALVHTAFELRSEHRLSIRTVADAVSQYRAQRSSTPAQSILRAA